MHDFLKIFLPWTWIANDNLCSLMLPQWRNQDWQQQIINTYSYSIPYITLLIMVFMQGEEQPGYSKCVHMYSFIDQKSLATALDNLAMWD